MSGCSAPQPAWAKLVAVAAVPAIVVKEVVMFAPERLGAGITVFARGLRPGR